jgi:SAM-dependent methyltransferase
VPKRLHRDTDFERFDREFFERFYRRAETRASSPDEFARLSRFVLSYLEYLEIPLTEVLDLGCGLGRWREALRNYDTSIRYTGVDASPYLCGRFGWIESNVTAFRSDSQYDLVICQDVLPYLSRRGIRDALANIARHCRGAAYLQILTLEDWDEGICDPNRTDETMNCFDAAWYRKALSRHFTNCGGGLFLPKDSDVVLWTLEHT